LPLAAPRLFLPRGVDQVVQTLQANGAGHDFVRDDEDRGGKLAQNAEEPEGPARGHEERFAPPRLSARCGFRKETIAGISRNGRDAPVAAIAYAGRQYVYRFASIMKGVG
jgi:hypothetical protein